MLASGVAQFLLISGAMALVPGSIRWLTLVLLGLAILLFIVTYVVPWPRAKRHNLAAEQELEAP